MAHRSALLPSPLTTTRDRSSPEQSHSAPLPTQSLATGYLALGLVAAAAVSMAAMAVSTLVGGLLSDRWNRRKVFVGVSAALAGLVMVVPVVAPTWPGMLVFSALNGLAFGCFMAVDTGVVTLVLPRAEDAARDMGVLDIANAGPQIVAPFVASAVVTALGGYTPLFLFGGALSLLGAPAILPIRGVR